MMYKHWKKIVLAVTAFFWNACDNSSTPTAPPVAPDSSSGTNLEPVSSATTNPSSSAVSPSSSAANPASSSVASPKSSSSVNAKSSSSSVTEKVSSSSLDQNADLYGCPPEYCGQEPSSSSVGSSSSAPIVKSSSSKGMIAPKYGVPIMSSSSQGFEAVPLYGVVSNVCVKSENDSTLSCNGVTCVESVTEKTQIPSCSGDQICAKYGVVVIRDTTYKCDDGKVYNEAEFKARYDMLTIVSKPEEKIPCYKDRGTDLVDCDDGQSFSIDTDEKGNRTYSNEFYRDLSEKEFLNKYEIFEQQPALYGPPCMFNGTCDEEK